jgi:hypothetical protein
VAGSTIDHMIAVTILIAALLLTMGIYNQMFASAVDYEGNRKVAMKAVDIINTACLSPGNPEDWGETNASLLGFGLQDPEAGGYALSPYSLMRLRSSSNDSQLVYYDKTGFFYNNISANYGNNILSPAGDCLNYTAATKMLGINGTYGFRLDIVPALDVNVSQVLGYDHLVLNVDVKGSGLPLSGATLNYYLFGVKKVGGDSPSIIPYSGVDQTGQFGSTLIEFEDIDGEDDAYSFTVYVSLGGVTGVGYYKHNTMDDDQFVVPLIEDFDQGKIIFAHSWDILYPGQSAEVKYNATFFILTSDFRLQQIQIENSTEHLNSGEGKPYFITQVPDCEVGLLVISYMKSANTMGTIILPWGIGTLGVSTSFGGDPTGYSFVATELRQVSINDITYQMKVSTWSLGD